MKRYVLNFHTSKRLRAKLARAAKTNGRTLQAEIEQRLEMSVTLEQASVAVARKVVRIINQEIKKAKRK